MSVYAELVKTVTPLGFHHDAAEESDTAYLGRLALAASALPDFEWSCLTAEAVEWVNASAKRLNFGKTVDSCPGFNVEFAVDPDDQVLLDTLPAPRAKDSLEGMGLAPGGYIGEDGKLVVTEFSIVDPSQLLDPHCVIGKAHVSSEVPVENIALDTVPEDSGDGYLCGETGAAGPPKAEGSRQGYEQEHAARSVSVSSTPSAAINKTDRIRSLVMQHPDWTQVQIKEAIGEDSALGTIATVRSVTLATIAVAKRLGKWVEA